MVRFKEFYNDGESALLIGTCQNNGEFDWYPVIKWMDVSGYGFSTRYTVSLLAVAPSLVPAEEWARAADCMGLSGDDPTTLDMVEAFAGYGIYAPLKEIEGNNLSSMMKEARKEAQIAAMLTGFYFDRPVNALGANGWHALRGKINPFAADYDEADPA